MADWWPESPLLQCCVRFCQVGYTFGEYPQIRKALPFNTMKNNKLPIGYYLKKADNLLTEGINNIFKALDINRLKWQILHSLTDNKRIDRSAMPSSLGPFADEEQIKLSIADLIERGLVQQIGDTDIKLTNKGEEFHQLCFQKQKAFRLKATEGLSQEAYFKTIETLEKIISNLE